MNNSSFGDRISKKFNIGDLVSWSDWGHSDDGRLHRDTKSGVLINIIRKHLGERDVTFAVVLPLDSSELIEINIVKLRKK